MEQAIAQGVSEAEITYVTIQDTDNSIASLSTSRRCRGRCTHNNDRCGSAVCLHVSIPVFSGHEPIPLPTKPCEWPQVYHVRSAGRLLYGESVDLYIADCVGHTTAQRLSRDRRRDLRQRWHPHRLHCKLAFRATNTTSKET